MMNVVVIEYYTADDLRDQITSETDAGNLTWSVCQGMFSNLMPFVEREGPHNLKTREISRLVDGVTMSIITELSLDPRKKKNRRTTSTLTIEPDRSDEQDVVVVRHDEYESVAVRPASPFPSPESTTATEYGIQTPSEEPTKCGCLFMRCISCPTMAMIEFASGSIPGMNHGMSYRNVGVLTSCSVHERQVVSNASKKSGDINTCAKAFETLCVDSDLFQDPRADKAMELIVGETVGWMEHSSGLVYLTREKIRTYTGYGEKIMSVDISEATIQRGTDVLLPYVLANFI